MFNKKKKKSCFVYLMRNWEKKTVIHATEFSHTNCCQLFGNGRSFELHKFTSLSCSCEVDLWKSRSRVISGHMKFKVLRYKSTDSKIMLRARQWNRPVKFNVMSAPMKFKAQTYRWTCENQGHECPYKIQGSGS